MEERLHSTPDTDIPMLADDNQPDAHEPQETEQQITALFSELRINTPETGSFLQRISQEIAAGDVTRETMAAYQELIEKTVDSEQGQHERMLFQIRGSITSAEVYFLAATSIEEPAYWDYCFDGLNDAANYADNMLDQDQNGKFAQILRKIDQLLELISGVEAHSRS